MAPFGAEPSGDLEQQVRLIIADSHMRELILLIKLVL